MYVYDQIFFILVLYSYNKTNSFILTNSNFDYLIKDENLR